MNKNFDVIIIGGSFAGLSAAMALGRAIRSVLVIDAGKPCNSQTPHSHNFLTRDGYKPLDLLQEAREQVLKYSTVSLVNGLVANVQKTASGFQATVDSGESFQARRLLFATGLKDIMPDIPGFAECWGISVLHCPYCHGYEVRNETTGILANGDVAFELAKLIHHWTKDLIVFTNGTAQLSPQQRDKLQTKGILVEEAAISGIEHTRGYVSQISLSDGGKIPLKAIYARPASKQHFDIPALLGCALTEQNLLKVDMMQKTSVDGIYAAGDNAHGARSLSVAIAAGTMAAGGINRSLIEESF